MTEFLEDTEESGAVNFAAIAGILQFVFLILKTTNSWDISWAWTFAPMTFLGAFTCLLLIVFNTKEV